MSDMSSTAFRCRYVSPPGGWTPDLRPSHREAAVLVHITSSSCLKLQPFAVRRSRTYAPKTERSRVCFPFALSIAFPTSKDFGNPCEYSHFIASRISKPASSIPQARRCDVRVPPKASRWPPGLSTRYASRAHVSHPSAKAAGDEWVSQPLPMKDRLYGGSQTTASILPSARGRCR